MAKSLKPAPVPQTRPVGVSTPVTQVSVPPASTVQPSTPAGSTPQPSRPQVAQVKAPDGQPFVDIQLTDARRIAAQRLTQSKVGALIGPQLMWLYDEPRQFVLFHFLTESFDASYSWLKLNDFFI